MCSSDLHAPRVIQRHQAREARRERPRIAEWQVGPPDGASEQAVSADDDLVADERHVPGRMARHMPHRERVCADGEAHPVGEVLVMRLGLVPRKAVARRRHVSVRVDGRVRRMEPDRDSRPRPSHGSDRADVVQVRVREPDGGRRHAVPRHEPLDRVELVAGLIPFAAFGLRVFGACFIGVPPDDRVRRAVAPLVDWVNGDSGTMPFQWVLDVTVAIGLVWFASIANIPRRVRLATIWVMPAVALACLALRR